MIIKITLHARDKMSALAISAELIRTAIQRGSRFGAGQRKFKAVYSFFTVVYVHVARDVYKIVTVYENK